MPYSVKLKDQTGSGVTYNSVEQVVLPLADKQGNAYFAAQYNVEIKMQGYTITGGNKAANSIDYVCCLDSTSVPESITITIGDKELDTSDYSYTKYDIANDHKLAVIKINGSAIVGNIVIDYRLK